jgi:hypothetical protein
MPQEARGCDVPITAHYLSERDRTNLTTYPIHPVILSGGQIMPFQVTRLSLTGLIATAGFV